jgi:hypothetical protein
MLSDTWSESMVFREIVIYQSSCLKIPVGDEQQQFESHAFRALGPNPAWGACHSIAEIH